MLPKFKQNDYITNGSELCKVLDLTIHGHSGVYVLEIINSVYGYTNPISIIDKAYTLIENKQYLEYLYEL